MPEEDKENFLEKLANGVKDLAGNFKEYKAWNGEQLSGLSNRIKALEDKSSESQTAQQ